MKDGHLNQCKKCTCARVRRHRVVNSEAVRQYDRERSKTEARREKAKAYGYTYSRVMRHKRSAHRILARAVECGKLIKRPCFVCGDPNSEAHHEDYSRPLDVIWFCSLHHKRHHHAAPLLDLSEF
jgi:hypothetical protein